MLIRFYFRCLLAIGLAFMIQGDAVAQQQNIVVKGTVTTDAGAALANATVSLKSDSTRATLTGPDGGYRIEVPANGTLVFTAIGYARVERNVQGEPVINAVLTAQTTTIDEVVVTAFGNKQKRSAMASSIVSVNPADLKGPTSNLTTMMSGRIAGMIAYQRSGEPGSDNASFFIRGVGSFGSGKVDPLILIDGIESSNTDLARLQPDDIAAFSVLKDATATAVYGARGANGVLLITTKSGISGKTKFSGRAENSISSNTRNFQFADNITYMELANEAALTRDPLAVLPYSQSKIDHTKNGDNPLLYPSNNWIDMLIKPYTMNQRYNLNIQGGGEKAQYYIAGTYNVDNGVLKMEKMNNFNNNIKLKNYSLRSNVNVKFTPALEGIVRLYAQFDDYIGPVGSRQDNGTLASGGSAVFNQAVWSNPVAFPAIYPSSNLPYIQHPLFGNAIIPGTSILYNNPYASMLRGYSEYNTSNIMAQVELKADLKDLTPGLNLRAMGYVKRYAYFDVTRQYNPFYYTSMTMDGQNISMLKVLNDGSTGSVGTVGTEYLSYDPGNRLLNSTFYSEFQANYNRVFNNVHAVTGMLIGTMRNYVTGNASNLQASLPARNMGLSGKATYIYDSRYIAEFNFGYNGSERFATDKKYGFFPSFGLAWNVNNEKFFEPLRDAVSQFKLRATYGLAGNDQIGNANDRFFYLSEVNPNSGGGYTFGLDYLYSRGGYGISRYSNPNITWEVSEQLNVGTDITLFKNLTIVVDAYKYKTRNILMSRSYIPTTMGLEAGVQANVGRTERQGMDVALTYNKNFGKDWWLQSRANLTYAKSKITQYDEPTYGDALSYLYHVGNSANQVYGYIAERLFTDNVEVANSPAQTFGEYMGGDIKYRDMDGDGYITANDMVPIGYPTTPEIIYGFGFSVGYKSFDLSTFFQGSARSSFWIDPKNIAPFVLGRYPNGAYNGAQNGLLQVIANDYWSEDNRNAYAFWPRLSQEFVNNNNQTSTWWMRDGAFLRLKTLELGFNTPEKLVKKIGFNTARIYANGSNLFVWSQFKMWDPEMGGNGLGYPVQRVFNLGINFGF